MADALAQVLDKQKSWDGFELGVDLGELELGGEKAGRAAVAYVGQAMELAWSALPSDIRADAIGALREFVGELLANSQLLSDIGDAISEGLSDAFEGIPIVEFIVKVIVTFVGIAGTVNDLNRRQSDFNRAQARNTMFDHEQHAFLVMRAPEVTPYPYWVFGGGETVRWRLRACLEPDQGAAKYWFGVNVQRPEGKWSKTGGMALKCPTFQDGPSTPYFGCRPHDHANKSDEFRGWTFVNALSWPYWSPNYPSQPMSVYQTEGSEGAYDFDGVYVDPNAHVVRAQMMVLLDAHTNFQVSASWLSSRTSHFMNKWHSLLFVHNGFCGIIDDHEEKRARDFAGKWTPDKVKDPHHTVDSPNAKRFYFGRDGLVHVYPGFEADVASGELDLAKIGVNTPLPVAPGIGYACSLADYNAVVSSTRAFFTARRAHLLNHATCKGLVSRNKHTDYRDDLKAAVIRSADLFNPYVKPGGLGLAPGDAEQKPPSGGHVLGMDDGQNDRPNKPEGGPRKPGDRRGKSEVAPAAAVGFGLLLLLLLL